MALAAVDVAMAVAAVAPERALATAAVDFCIIVLEEEAAGWLGLPVISEHYSSYP